MKIAKKYQDLKSRLGKIDGAELLDDLQEIMCTNIEEPAGPRCGYGISESGQEEMTSIINNFMLKLKHG